MRGAGTSEGNAHLEDRQLLLREGTLVEATIIAAPSSRKNQRGERDPDMHQTQKGNQWYFGMKAHIGADAASGLVHTVAGTAANVSDINARRAHHHSSPSGNHRIQASSHGTIAELWPGSRPFSTNDLFSVSLN